MASKDQLVQLMGLSAPETMPEAAFDDEGVVGVDLDPSQDSLEAGIAAVFDAIRNGGSDAAAGSHQPPEDNGATFALLGELNRLWEHPPA